ncbi:nuclear transport factor 2 family protein [Streptomyces iconiensis]|uniref:Nuclear transport factor 2 family protein n=1 Tax=Streptomyces iconiensis TaxID=1384038 RepID=A0ABT7A4S6_9ACTN|nr:nuclear transport factor 2 family protein [Streptomyces iconiensis]MDJ1136353.1 nuclear transport factor 2 family protein [Streptomyces iconiensis]
MSRTAQEIFESYVYAGAVSRDADALAAHFTVDGVFEAPLMPDGAAFPRRLVGREEIRSGMAAYYERQARENRANRAPNLSKSGYVLHTTSDPEVFIAEIDTVFDGEETVFDGEGTVFGGEGTVFDGEGTVFGGAGGDVTVSLVQIFRVRDGKIARLRDYFAPELMS